MDDGVLFFAFTIAENPKKREMLVVPESCNLGGEFKCLTVIRTLIRVSGENALDERRLGG